MELQFLFSAHCLIMVYICIKVGKNIKRFQSYGAERLWILLITKGYISMNIIHEVKVLFSNQGLHLNQVSHKYLERFLESWSGHNFYIITGGINP